MKRFLCLLTALANLACTAAAADVMVSLTDIVTATAVGVRPGKLEVPVMIRGAQVASIRMTMDMRIDTASLLPWVRNNMNETAQARFAALGPQAKVDEISAVGLALVYDDTEAVFALTPDPAQLKKKNLSLQDENMPVPGDAVLSPAPLSAFMNLRGGADYVERGPNEGRQPARISLDGAINKNGWVIEGQGNYLEDAGRTWQRENIRLVRDWPDKMVRLAAGDLSYPVTGFQSYQPMLGVSVARAFDLQPYLVTTPSGNTSFTVHTPSRADVIVNGRKVRTLYLDPGSYDVSDFPVADGSNDVTLAITDATGRVEERKFSLLGDQQLLKPGLHAYAYNIGIRSEEVSRRTEYHGDKPAISFFHRYGFRDGLTAGIAAQGDADVQQAGLTLLKAVDAVLFGLEGFVSHGNSFDSDVAATTFMRLRNPGTRHDFSAQVRYRGRNFASLGTLAPQPSNVIDIALRYSRPLGWNISAGTGGRYVFKGAAADDWSYSVFLTKSVSNAVTVTLNGEHKRTDGAGVFLNVTWSPPQSRHMVSATLDTLAETKSTEWRYRSERMVGDVRGGIGLAEDSDGRISGIGDVNYTGYRGTFSARHNLVSGVAGAPVTARTQVFAGTALAYAGGHLAVSRPIANSFVMLARHASLAAYDVGINPENAATAESVPGYQARIDALGPAVVPDMVPYVYRAVKVDARNLPIGYDVGRDAFSALPTYKSGAVVEIGTARNIFADGYLRAADGKSVALSGGILRGVDGSTQEFFTNAEGRFRINNLSPGVYALLLYKYPGQNVTLEIPQDAAVGRLDAGILTLAESAP